MNIKIGLGSNPFVLPYLDTSLCTVPLKVGKGALRGLGTALGTINFGASTDRAELTRS